MSEYKLGQYNWARGVGESTFMEIQTPIASAIRVRGLNDYNVTDGKEKLTIFKDEALYLETNLLPGQNYYLHGKIKRLPEPQVFNIKLVNVIKSNDNYEIRTDTDYTEQYITQLIVAGGDLLYDPTKDQVENSWVDFEFVFSPIINFNTIFFELQRNVDDFKKEQRHPKIAYEELSKVNNALPIIINGDIDKKNVIKIGVQSRPGFLMCINGESIRSSRSGIYEIKNGIITVSFFSVCAPCEENSTDMQNWMNNVNIEMDKWIRRIGSKDLMDSVHSEQFLNTNKAARIIDAFTIDYLYYQFDT